MRYCADTWYILKLFERDEKSIKIFDEIRFEKSEMIIPILVVSESLKKLLQRGISEKILDSFFETMDRSERIEIIFFDKLIAKEGAKISLSYSIPLIDSLIIATSKLTDCNLVLTDDGHFKKLEMGKLIKTKSW